MAELFFKKEFFSGLGEILVNQPFVLLLIVIFYAVLFGLIVFFIWISIVSQAAAVNNSANIYSSQEHSFRGGLTKGVIIFWPIFILNLIVKFVFYLGFFLISLPFLLGIFKQNTLAGSFVFTFLFLIFIFCGIIFSFIAKYAVSYIIVNNQKLREAMINGWKLFLKNWLVSLEMAFILFFIDFFISILIIAVLTYIIFPLVVIALAMYSLKQFFIFWFLLFLFLLVFFVAVIIPRSILTIFQIYSWTDLFMVLISKGAISKLVRITSLIKKQN
jgi:hypothetical protein